MTTYSQAPNKGWDRKKTCRGEVKTEINKCTGDFKRTAGNPKP